MGGALSGTCASVFRAQGAAHSRPDESLALASVQGNLGIPAVDRQMRRRFGPCGGVARKEVLAATVVEVNSYDDDVAA